MFLFFLFISQSYTITPISLDSQFKWMTSDNVTKENIYSIPNNQQQQQYYVNVTLEQQDPEFYLIVTLGQPFNRFNNTVTNYFDWISQLENRLTRFIKFQPQEQDIYITTIGNIIQQYNISIIATDNDLCQNDCNNNGICKNKGCKCNQLYIGNDCHQKAQQILLNEENQYPLRADEINYLYISEEDQRSICRNISLVIDSNNPNQTQFIIQRTPILYIPGNNQTLDEEYQVFNFTDVKLNHPKVMNITIDDKHPKPIVFIAKSKEQNSIFFIRSQENDFEQSLLTDTQIIIITCSIGGFLLILGIIVFIVVRCRSKKQESRKQSYSVTQRANSNGFVAFEIEYSEKRTASGCRI